MRAVALIRNVLTSNERFLERALDGLTDADLIKRPGEETNPIGWLLWHQTRVEDATIAAILEQPQVWVTQDWAHQLGLAADAEDLGIGHTLDQVVVFRPSLSALSGYRQAVRERTLSCLTTLTDEDLEGENYHCRSWNGEGQGLPHRFNPGSYPTHRAGGLSARLPQWQGLVSGLVVEIDGSGGDDVDVWNAWTRREQSRLGGQTISRIPSSAACPHRAVYGF